MIVEQSEDSKKEALERAKISNKLMKNFLESSTEWNKDIAKERRRLEIIAKAGMFNKDFFKGLKKDYFAIEESPKILKDNISKMMSFNSFKENDDDEAFNEILDDLINKDFLENKALFSLLDIGLLYDENDDNDEQMKKNILKKRIKILKEEYNKNAKKFNEITDEIKSYKGKNNPEQDTELARFKKVSLKEKNKVTGTEFEKILASGSDFLPSHYNAAFLWSDGTNNESFPSSLAKSNTISKIENLFLNSNGLAVRMVNIGIPQMKNVSYTVAGVNHDIKKISSSKNVSRKSTFTFRLDTNLAWLNIFGQLIGENNFYEVPKKDENGNAISSWNNVASDRRLYAQTIATCLASKSPLYGLKNNLCLYVKDINSNRHICFKDVRIVGAGNDISYSSEGGPTELTIDFIFRKMEIL